MTIDMILDVVRMNFFYIVYLLREAYVHTKQLINSLSCTRWTIEWMITKVDDCSWRCVAYIWDEPEI